MTKYRYISEIYASTVPIDAPRSSTVEVANQSLSAAQTENTDPILNIFEDDLCPTLSPRVEAPELSIPIPDDSPSPSSSSSSEMSNVYTELSEGTAPQIDELQSLIEEEVNSIATSNGYGN